MWIKLSKRKPKIININQKENKYKKREFAVVNRKKAKWKIFWNTSRLKREHNYK